MRVVEVDPRAPDPGVVGEAARVLRAGGVVAIPTETVYGLAADAADPAAVRRIFALKGRPGDNPLIAHVADLDAGHRLAGVVTPLARCLAERWWPGPLTLVVPARERLAPEVTAGLGTVGLRCPSHPVAAALLGSADLALAAPSANRSGRPSPTTAAHVVADFGGSDSGGRPDLVLDAGPAGIGLESTVVDARGDEPTVLREGAISREALGLTADRSQAAGTADLHRSPGTRHRHYAPTCAVEVVAATEVARRAVELGAAGVPVGAVLPTGTSSGPAILVAEYSTVEDLGRQLFAALRAAEARGCQVVLVAEVPEEGLGRAVMDRLRRAAGHTGA